MPSRNRALARTVSNRIAANTQRFAEVAGLSPQRFAALTGIAPDELADPAGRIDGIRHRRTVELAVSLGQFYRPQDAWRGPLFAGFPQLGNLCLNAPDLRSALEAFMDYRALVGEFDFLLWEIAAPKVRLQYIAEFAPDCHFQALWNFHVLAGLVRAYDPGTSTRFEVELVGPAPAFAAEIDEFFGAPVRYGRTGNRMHFNAPHLDAPFARYNASLAPLGIEQAQRELARIQRMHRFSAEIEGLILELINDPVTDTQGAALLEALCDRLHTSRWSLNRRLQSDGTHFRELELRVKLGESRRLLHATPLSVGEISERLGFSSQSAFSRFFQAQQGVAPLAFRRQQTLS
ncbi:helix-turn-helix domain-containing protein [Niveibacterium sp. SC-1]|uniref:helix-turn-helix transcriptional regulator n=1 Tax=Niveibacterium sp. SC-1 TaxID=3135646 RepID=UPI00311F547A